MSERFALPTLRQAYIAVPSTPNTSEFGGMTENGHPPVLYLGKDTARSFLMDTRRSSKGAFAGDNERFPSNYLPTEVVRNNLVCCFVRSQTFSESHQLITSSVPSLKLF